jgi:hypothetical protein
MDTECYVGQHGVALEERIHLTFYRSVIISLLASDSRKTDTGVLLRSLVYFLISNCFQMGT